jgi:hypothetical protein
MATASGQPVAILQQGVGEGVVLGGSQFLAELDRDGLGRCARVSVVKYLIEAAGLAGKAGADGGGHGDLRLVD